MHTRSLQVALVFAIGCAVGGASAQLAVPSAQAQSALKATVWQYYCVDLPQDPAGQTVAASALGEKSWELVTLNVLALRSQRACFKRPKPY